MIPPRPGCQVRIAFLAIVGFWFAACAGGLENPGLTPEEPGPDLARSDAASVPRLDGATAPPKDGPATAAPDGGVMDAERSASPDSAGDGEAQGDADEPPTDACPAGGCDAGGGLPASGPHIDFELGYTHSCARNQAGTVWCWGENNAGQVGDGTTVNQTKPVAIGGLAEVAVIHTGQGRSCAVQRDGKLFCWGTGHGSRPVEVKGLTGPAAGVGIGKHVCAVLGDTKAALRHLKSALEDDDDKRVEARTDPELASLRDNAQFQKLIA